MNSFPQMVTIQENNARLEALRWQSVAHSAERELQATKQELHDFRQEVSDAVRDYYGGGYVSASSRFAKFIITAPKPDPLVDVLLEMDLSSDLKEGEHDAKWLRIKLDARGFEIREKNDG